MSSTDTPATNAAPAALENSKPSASAKAAVEGKSLPADKLEQLAGKLNISDASDNESRPHANAAGESAEVEKKKKKSSKSKDAPSSKSAGDGKVPKVQNLATFDPFADADELETQDALEKSTKAPEYVHIRIQQRNGRKTLTTVQGVPNEYDPKKLLKHFKKEFACNGTLVEDEELGEVIQLQGDQRSKISQMLVEDVGLPRETIKIHGF